ncbi:Cj0069 family protein [Campylobacter sp. MIT 21-1685]|uniref:Cj0069 family protein n=1 Tax=unclassified Campylobacter TaxID=2593542 RepID=UPI00224B7399|nr:MULTISPECIES: Cj0069 family protein [unclassified Campylobacter]MCX2683292.1 Cj0069 family protein [Campylobacter sp. MIT 21-1684]MCX2751515.1 Cj0069 family protein [Campylobacter sp. MIT 21-1682]MCX2807714.1 Cj0069 family protein [Campylobacter sp. MIT 21-1685]
MKKSIVFFEVRGGSDKGEDGYRKDTMPMVNALKERGWNAEVVFFEIAKKDEIYLYVKENFDGYVSRINPGNLKEENEYFDMLRQLCKDGLIGMPHPDAMIGYGAKDALTKLVGTDLVPNDTYAYYDIKTFKETFPKSLAKGERVLKQNRGSTGEGIWRVSVEGNCCATDTLPLNTKIKCTEAKDNHVEYRELGEFMDFCEQYIIGDNGMLVDMTFLPRIKEGEIRLLMLYNTPVNVVHKKPAEGSDAFSATLFSGAKYRYDKPEQWKELVDMFLNELPKVRQKLGDYDLPLIWTADFILDTDSNGKDKYILGEINCSCVGFTSHLELAGEVAENIIQIVSKA